MADPSDFRDADVLRLLELVLAEPDPALARLCVQVADRLNITVASVADRLELPQHATPTSAMHALAELCGYGCVDLALRLAGHWDPTVRAAAIEALEDIDDPRVRTALGKAPPDSDPDVRRVLDRVRSRLDLGDVQRRAPTKPPWLTVSEAPVARLLVGRVPDAEIPNVLALRRSSIAAVREAAERYADQRFNNVLASLKSNPTMEGLKLLERLTHPGAVAYLDEVGLSGDLRIGEVQVDILRNLRTRSAARVLLKWLQETSHQDSHIWWSLAFSGDEAVSEIVGVLPTLAIGKRRSAAALVDIRWPRELVNALLGYFGI